MLVFKHESQNITVKNYLTFLLLSWNRFNTVNLFFSSDLSRLCWNGLPIWRGLPQTTSICWHSHWQVTISHNLSFGNCSQKLGHFANVNDYSLKLHSLAFPILLLKNCSWNWWSGLRLMWKSTSAFATPTPATPTPPQASHAWPAVPSLPSPFSLSSSSRIGEFPSLNNKVDH